MLTMSKMSLRFGFAVVLSLCALCSRQISAAQIGTTELVAGVAERLLQPSLLRGEFVQSKQVSGFKKPLQSRGKFLVARDRGVLWETKQPFPSQLKLTKDEIVASQDGEVAFRLSASNEPTVRVMNSLLFSLLNGDVKSLTAYFIVDGNFNGKSWHLVLTPKQTALAKFMTRVELSGDRYVREITLSEANSDITNIRFSSQSEPEKLTPEDVARFE